MTHLFFGQSLTRPINNFVNTWIDPHPKLVVLGYHRVLTEVSYNPLKTIVSAKKFEAQLENLMAKYPIVALGSAIQQRQNLAKTQVVLTFDDGYEDNYRIVFPILSKKALPATFFVTTDWIDRGRPLWDGEVITRLCACRIAEIRTDEVRLSKRTEESFLTFALRVIERLKGAKFEDLERTLERIREDSTELDLDFGRVMNWEEVRALSKGGMEIGAHSTTHRSLARLAPAEAMDEIARSKQVIESQTAERCVHFAFPFGNVRDYNPMLTSAVREMGFQSCSLALHGYNHVPEENFSLRRIQMTETTDLRYLLAS
jgi:peptidoglycan/xylan/chitin deacetylase (PgdA/CDA1 family)